MRRRLAAISSRYDAIEHLIDRLVRKSVLESSGGGGAYEQVPVNAAREDIEEAVVGFFAAARIDASAVELPAFARMAQLLQRHARHGYPHLSAAQLRSRLPASSASEQGDGFAAAYGHVHDLDLAALTSEETTELH